jgi:peptidoglycan/LPS O-acetylase OafA/YrhL
MEYRREIDGLRALAVVPVILFHAGITTFNGGFVGVDIFFVISGYLITTIIVAEMALGKFSMLNFYEKRIRRILPALFFVMLCTLPFAWALMLPTELRSFSQSLISVPLFASNALFYFTTGYFESASELKPLLHTWSLAVEEQYYVLFPLFLMAAWKLGRKPIIYILIAMAIFSLAFAQWGVASHPSFVFFLLPTRGWEILIGALISLFVSYKATIISTREPMNPMVAQIASMAGLMLVLYAIFSFDKDTPSPSIYTLIPTIGAGLILVFADGRNLVGKLLGSKLLVGIGLISYSAYLWHQPLFAFARLKGLENPGGLLLPLLSGLSFALAYMTWKFVERPFKNRLTINRKLLLAGSLGFTVFFISLGLAGHVNWGYKHRLNKDEREILAFQNYDFTSTLNRYSCFMEETDTAKQFKRECYANHGPDSYMLWGDSYAAASSKGLKSIHPDVMQLTASACPPLIDTEFADRPNCLAINNFIKEKVRELKPAKIFLQANWYRYAREDVVENMTRTLNYIKEVSPATKIVIIGSTPQWQPALPLLLVDNKVGLGEDHYVAMPSYQKLNAVDTRLKQLSRVYGIQFLSILDNMCIDAQCLAVTEYRGKHWLTSWDNGHLSEAGSLFLYGRFANAGEH